MRRIVAAIGLGLGLLVGFVLPSSWVFVDDMRGQEQEAADALYACPMFCVIMEERPHDGKCPVCGMELGAVTGRSTLTLAERRMVGLEAAALHRLPLARTVRVVGEVDFDETRIKRITTRTAGWLEQVWVDTTWTPVKKGEKLAAIYSPELYAAQKELLTAGANLRGAAERRLKLLGVSAEEIAELRRSGRVQETLVLRAPRGGVVVERSAVEGGSVKKGDTLYTVADLSHVWVQAEVFERDLVWILEGQEARLELETRADPIVGRVAFIDPVLDRHTRTARIRIEVENPGALLRVGQRVDVWLRARVDAAGAPSSAPEADPLALARSAVLSTGRRHIAYVLFTETVEGRDYDLDPAALPDVVMYEMVEVRVGPPATREGEEYYPLIRAKGLELRPGLVFVTKGNLLLDSQAQLSGKPSLLFPQGNRGDATDPHAGHR
jgi:Cu(I)/Ag(I) efflux system membrane fusion protein